MVTRRRSRGLALALAASMAAASAPAQTPAPPEGPGAEAAPPAAPAPGQTQELGAPATPQDLAIGEIHWYPLRSRCAFFTPERQAAFASADPESWRFVFVSMLSVEDPAAGSPAIERGYVMANGLLRELEKNRTGPDRDGRIVSIWRSNGEPRINVELVVAPVEGAPPTPEGRTSQSGEMTLLWGDREASVAVAGDCEAP